MNCLSWEFLFCFVAPAGQKEGDTQSSIERYSERAAAKGNDKNEKQSSPFVDKSTRQKQLRSLFELFDLDDGGTIGKDELMLLGQTRRSTGQKQGTWTEDMNQRLLVRMTADKGRSGMIKTEVSLTLWFDSLTDFSPGDLF